MTPENLRVSTRVGRRHLFAAATIGATALAGRAAQAREWWWWRGDHDHDRDDQREFGGERVRHCFAPGTMIRTPDGERAVENLDIGDEVVTAFQGNAEISAVTAPEMDRSVRIKRSALAHEVPYADLIVSAPHAVLIEGDLVAAGCLVNGRSIIWEPIDSRIDFYHLVLARHDLIYANGVPCETLLMPDEKPCLPLHRYGWRRGEVASHLRSAIAPVVDFRRPQDIARDRIEARL